MNYVRTAILLAGLTALFMGVGFLIGGQTGALIALVIAAGMNLFSSGTPTGWCCRCTAPRRSMRLPRPISTVWCRSSPSAGHRCRACRIDSRSRTRSRPGAARRTLPQSRPRPGALNAMSREEVAGVMAHELAHIKNRDTLIMTLTATIAGAISMLAQFGMFFGGNRENNNGMGIIGTIAMVILAPIAAMLVQMAISRTREYAADRMGAEIVGEPRYLASALARLENAAHQIPNEAAERNPATAHLFIINPLSGQRMDSLFSTPCHREPHRRAGAACGPDGPHCQPGTAPSGAGGNCGTRSVGRRSRRGPWS